MRRDAADGTGHRVRRWVRSHNEVMFGSMWARTYPSLFGPRCNVVSCVLRWTLGQDE